MKRNLDYAQMNGYEIADVTKANYECGTLSPAFRSHAAYTQL